MASSHFRILCLYCFRETDSWLRASTGSESTSLAVISKTYRQKYNGTKTMRGGPKVSHNTYISSLGCPDPRTWAEKPRPHTSRFLLIHSRKVAAAVAVALFWPCSHTCTYLVPFLRGTVDAYIIRVSYLGTVPFLSQAVRRLCSTLPCAVCAIAKCLSVRVPRLHVRLFCFFLPCIYVQG